MLQLLKKKMMCHQRRRAAAWGVLGIVLMLLFISISRHKNIGPVVVFTWRRNQPREPCHLLNLDPNDKAVEEYMESVPDINCSSWPHPITFVKNSKFYINTTLASRRDVTSCHVHYLRRPSALQFWRRDYDIVYSGATEVKPGQSLLLVEDFIYVECRTRSKETVYTNYHAHISNAHFEKIVAKAKARYQYNRQNPNVIVLAIESLSRLNFERKYRQTYETLVETLKGVVMKGHHKVGDNSIPNVLAMLTGRSYVRDLKDYSPHLYEYMKPWSRAHFHLDELPFVWEGFSQNGYATLFAEDSPKISILTGQSAGFFKEPTDWYMRTFWQAMEEQPRDNLTKASPKHCRGTIPVSQLLFAWSFDAIARSIKNGIPIFGFTFVTEITHHGINFPPSFDKDIAEYLSRLNKAGFLDNTFLFFTGDHGLRTTDYRKSFFGKVEDRMPLLVVRPPPWFQTQFPLAYDNIIGNTGKLTSHFDTHETFEAVLSGKYDQVTTDLMSPGISVFRAIPELRLCEEAGVGPHFCTCELGHDVNITSIPVIQAAEASVSYINNKLLKDGAGTLCHPLRLNKLSLASIQRPAKSQGSLPSGSLAHLTFTTLPSRAIYEATLMMNEREQWEVTDGLSRLDWYAPQVKCVPKSLRPIEKYCFCRDLIQ